MQFFMLLREFLEDIRKQKTRAFLTTIAITWGTLAVILLMAFGEGLSFRMRESLLNAGNRIIRVYGGQTTQKYQGLPVGRSIRMRLDDAGIIQNSIPEVESAIGVLGRQTRLRRDGVTVSTFMEGVFPEFEFMRRMFPDAGGRFINDRDVMEKRRVLFLGQVIASELFGGQDPVGQIVTVDGNPFTVIGIMPKKMQTSMNNGPDDRRAIIPFTTFQSIYGNRNLNEMLVKPRYSLDNRLIISEIRRILGRKYQFDPADELAMPVWDFIEDEKIGAKVFTGINVFLAVIGAMTLIIAGVGVANIMFVVVKERTHEIGIKRAVGAKRRHIIFQFIFESLLIAVIGGGTGLLLAWGLIKLIWTIPAGDGAMQFLGRPILSFAVVFITVSVLTLIGLLAGLFPARKAAGIDPVEALRYE
ncbi:MAG TPA: ABC transporter permease [bacterium]|nr:ABC transporter permease [bacterium]